VNGSLANEYFTVSNTDEQGSEMRDLASVKRAVKETLSRQFGHVRISDVRVREDTDSDGDEVLRIDVIFDGSSRDLDAKKLAGFIGHLQPRLEQMHETALPLLYFISSAELSRDKRASA
jgi:hypothetical protein